MSRGLLSFLILVMLSIYSYATKEPKPMAADHRLRTFVYNPNEVFSFTGYYGYQSSIIFQNGETIDSITMGDSISWQVVPSGNRLFLKPVEQNATTNMTLITNKRVYYFELHANQTADINDPGLIFAARFLYNEDMAASYENQNGSAKLDTSDLSKYNFKYSISGPESIAPLEIYDDGEMTYFKFRNKNSEIPAFFFVGSDGKEAIINYRVIGGYVVIERVAKKFTLRQGRDVVCVFNEGPVYREVLLPTIGTTAP